ncbi:NUDIX domain-containing protein [Kaarinaea lacus]
MAKISAGILLYRDTGNQLEVFLVHPGGPLWAAKDLGAWSIPKGECDEGEDDFATAKREFKEETGMAIDGEFLALTPVEQSRYKTVHAWALRGDIDAGAIKSNKFTLEWPPKSGNFQQIPEVDRGAWFSLVVAKQKIVKGQLPLLDELQQLINVAK